MPSSIRGFLVTILPVEGAITIGCDNGPVVLFQNNTVLSVGTVRNVLAVLTDILSDYSTAVHQSLNPIAVAFVVLPLAIVIAAASPAHRSLSIA